MFGNVGKRGRGVGEGTTNIGHCNIGNRHYIGIALLKLHVRYSALQTVHILNNGYISTTRTAHSFSPPYRFI